MSIPNFNSDIALDNMIRQQLRPWNVLDPHILELFAVVRREDFVPEALRGLAYADTEIQLGKGLGQEMWAPKINARILQDLALKNTDKVLEVGAGSGYMAALLAARAAFVYSVEIEQTFVDMARQNLKKVGILNASVDLGDAGGGWSLYAPYDVIVLSGSVTKVPPVFLHDLKLGGRLAAVVGKAPAMQIQIITRTGEDTFSTTVLFETVVAPLKHMNSNDDFIF